MPSIEATALGSSTPPSRDGICQPELPSPIGQLVVFYFDWTLIDTDNKYLFNKFLPRLPDVERYIPFFDRVRRSLESIRECNVTSEEVGVTLENLRISNTIVANLRTLSKNRHTTLLCLSEADKDFVDSKFKKSNIDQEMFEDVIINREQFALSEMIRKIKAKGITHCGSMSNFSMYKVDELEGYVHNASLFTELPYSPVVYVGKGQNMSHSSAVSVCIGASSHSVIGSMFNPSIRRTGKSLKSCLSACNRVADSSSLGFSCG